MNGLLETIQSEIDSLSVSLQEKRKMYQDLLDICDTEEEARAVERFNQLLYSKKQTV